MDRYTMKRMLLRPLTAWRRHRAQRLGSINVSVWEAMDYRPSMRTFFHAMRADPDLLISADLPSGAVALDLGAFEGEWTRRLLARADAEGVENLRIHAFEPEPGAVDHLLATVGQDPRVVIHPYGLAGRDRREPLSIGGPGSSVFDNPSVPTALGVTEIDLRDIDGVLRDLGVDRVDVVKINIEGGEFEVLDRLHASGWLARTGTVIVQFHEFAPGAHRARRRNRRQLAETHRCTWNHAWIYERWDPR